MKEAGHFEKPLKAGGGGDGFSTRFEIKVPQLAETVAFATLLSWKKKLGDAVREDEILVEIETDKVILEVPAVCSGFLVEVASLEGDQVAMDQVIGVIDRNSPPIVKAAELGACLIAQSDCGRLSGNPVCPKCGMDDRVVFPGQADLDFALMAAKSEYWRNHAAILHRQLEEKAAAGSVEAKLSERKKEMLELLRLVGRKSAENTASDDESDLGNAVPDLVRAFESVMDCVNLYSKAEELLDARMASSDLIELREEFSKAMHSYMLAWASHAKKFLAFQKNSIQLIEEDDRRFFKRVSKDARASLAMHIKMGELNHDGWMMNVQGVRLACECALAKIDQALNKVQSAEVNLGLPSGVEKHANLPFVSKVKKIIAAQLDVDISEVLNHKSFVEFGVDSLDVVELVMAIEDEFGMEIPDDEAEKILTVQQAIDYVARRVNQ